MIDPPKEAFILAAGIGSRLRPYTDTLPKPMVEVAGRPIIDYALDRLCEAGVGRVVVNLHHKAEVLETHLRARKNPEILFSSEPELLDTGGGVKKALPMMAGGPFYLLNGDALWSDAPGSEGALLRLAEAFDPNVMDMVLLLQPLSGMTLTGGAGDYDLGADGRAARSVSKDGAYMFAGIRILDPKIFESAPQGAFSFLRLMDESERRGRLFGLAHAGEWHHISTAADLEAVNRAFLRGSVSEGGAA